MGKYLEFYKDCMRTGVLPKEGLCKSVGKRNLKLFVPTSDEYGIDIEENSNDFFWGAFGYRGHGASYEEVSIGFTPLRQNIVLFMAAMNNEL